MAKRVRLNSERLSTLLAETRLSQNAWARRLGISKSYLSQLANGTRRYPGAAVRARLVSAFRVPHHELFECETVEPSPGRMATDIPDGKDSKTALFRLAGRSVQIRVEPLDTKSRKAGDNMLQILLQDVKYGLRVLIANPGFSLACLVLLAVGIGSNTTLYSLVHGVLLKPLSLPEPSRLVTLWERSLDQPEDRDWVSPANFIDWKEQSSSFESIAAFEQSAAVLTGFDEPLNVQAVAVTSGFLEALGVDPALGRFFLPEEYQRGNERVVVLSGGLWRRCFGGGAIEEGKTLTLEGREYRVVGVVSADGRFPSDGDVWMPLVFDFDVAASRGAHYLKTLARLAPSVDSERAGKEMDLIGTRLREAYPDKNANKGIAVIPLQEDLVSAVKPTLLVLWGSVTVILLIACVNTANLFLTRSLRRGREIAIRLAMGAGRSRIVCQLLTESLILSLAAGLVGVALAYFTLPLFLAALPFQLPRLASVQIDGTVLLYTLSVSLACGVAFGLVPAVRAFGPHLRESLTPVAGASPSPAQSRLRNALVVVEVALAVTLVISAGLFLRALLQLQAVEPGFDPSKVVAIRLSLPDARYDESRKRQFYQFLTEEISTVPGVSSVGTVAWLPLGDAWVFSFEVEGEPPPTAGQGRLAVFLPVSGRYFQTMGIRLLRGRDFGALDRAGAPLTVMISDTFAKRYFPNQDPIGKRVKIGYGRAEPQPREIVGVVSDVKQWGLGAPSPPCFYLPHQQVPFGGMQLVVRSELATEPLIKTLKSAIWKLDSELALSEVQTLTDRVYGATAGSRFRSLLVGSFGLSAALLALFGIYGVISFAFSQRSREIGIRMALGARSRQVVSMVLGQGLKLALVGTLLGMAMAWAVSGSLSRFLFGIGPTDPATYVAAGALMAVLATLASYIPARRASRTDPAAVLRHE